MKKTYLLLFAAAPLLASAAGNISSKFDAPSMLAVDKYKQLQANPGMDIPAKDFLPFDPQQMLSRSGMEASVIVTFNPGYNSADLAQFGLEASSEIDDMAVVRGSMEGILALAESDVVTNLSFGTKANLLTDRARTAVGIDKVHAGTDLKKAYTGAGVITGLFDNGIDPNHIAFFTNNNAKTGTNRVKRLWNYSSSSPVCYDTPERIAGFKTENTYVTHGTHVMGLMAGSYNGKGGKWATTVNDDNFDPKNPAQGFAVKISSTTPNPYYGMATGSDIVVSCGSTTPSNLLDGVSRMVSYAKSVNKPAVINLSLGNNTGPHDGTDNFCKMLDKYAEQAIICIANGNEAEERMSVSKTLTAADKVAKTFLEHDNKNVTGQGIIDVWTSNNSDVSITLGIYDVTTGQAIYNLPIKNAGTYSIKASSIDNVKKAYDGASEVAISFQKNNAANNRHNLYINYYLHVNSATNADGRYALGIVVEGQPGTRIDMTHTPNSDETECGFSSMGLSGWSEGSGIFSTNAMACGHNVITVGAFNTRYVTGFVNRVYSYYTTEDMRPDKIGSYSSYGTLIDGRTTPEICAPGTGIIGPISTYYVEATKTDVNYTPAVLAATHASANGRQHVWDSMQGTSMASPIVAGTIATWLEADPSLTHEDVSKILKATAIKDTYTATTGNPVQWGAGKLNAYEGLKAVLKGGAGVNDIVVNPSKVLVSSLGANSWEAFDGNASQMNVDIYNIAGSKVASHTANGNTLQFSTMDLVPGVYVITVNNRNSQKIVVK